MRNCLFSAMLLAFGSIASFAAPCAVGPVNLSTMTGSCTFGGWSLGGFGLAVPTSAWGYLGEPATNNFMVEIAAAPALSGYGAGLSVSFSAAPGGPNFLTANSGNPNQTSSFTALFNIESGPAFDEAQLFADVATVSSGNNGLIVVQAATGDPSLFGNPAFANGTVLTISNLQSQNPVSLSGFPGNTRTLVSVADSLQINSGGSGSASISAFTNLFYLPAAPSGPEVPEPMTYTLIGSGLIAITVLRRRS